MFCLCSVLSFVLLLFGRVTLGVYGGLLLSGGSLLFLGVTRGFSQRITVVRGFTVVWFTAVGRFTVV